MLRDIPRREGIFRREASQKKSKAGIYLGDMVAFHSACVCCFKVKAEREAERQLVGFALMVHIKYF